MTDPSPDQAGASPPPDPKGMSTTGKIVLWVIAALVVIPIVAVAGTFLSILLIGYNR